jgi:hypothetical protein
VLLHAARLLSEVSPAMRIAAPDEAILSSLRLKAFDPAEA